MPGAGQQQRAQSRVPPACGRKGKLWAVTSSEKQGCVVVSCHKCQIHTWGCRWEGEVGKGWGALLRRVSPPVFLPVAAG